MNELLKVLLSAKGQVINRNLLLAVLLYVAWQVTELRARVAVIESRLQITTAAVTRTPAPRPE